MVDGPERELGRADTIQMEGAANDDQAGRHPRRLVVLRDSVVSASCRQPTNYGLGLRSWVKAPANDPR